MWGVAGRARSRAQRKGRSTPVHSCSGTPRLTTKNAAAGLRSDSTEIAVLMQLASTGDAEEEEKGRAVG